MHVGDTERDLQQQRDRDRDGEGPRLGIARCAQHDGKGNVAEHEQRTDAVSDLDRDARRTVEHAAFVVDADAAPEDERFAEIHIARPPLAQAGRKIEAAGERGIVRAGPAAERDLHRDQAEADRGQPPELVFLRGGKPRIGNLRNGQAQRRVSEQDEDRHAAEQMGHNHDRLQFPSHRPHAEQGLEQDEDRRGKRYGGEAVQVATTAPGPHRERERRQDQAAGEEAMHLLAPGLVGFDRPIGKRRIRRVDFVSVHGPSDLAVAGRPVRTRQAGVRQAHERAEHDHHERERGGDPGEAGNSGCTHFFTSRKIDWPRIARINTDRATRFRRRHGRSVGLCLYPRSSVQSVAEKLLRLRRSRHFTTLGKSRRTPPRS